MAIDDRCRPNPLVNLRSISVDFIVWSLCIMILSKFGLSLFSSDHTFTHSLNEVVFLWIILMCPGRKVWCPKGAYQFYIDLCRGHGFLQYQTNGLGWRSGHASSSIWPRKIQISCRWVKFMKGMMCRVVGASTSFQIAMHWQLQPTFFQGSFIGFRVHTWDWAGAECSECQSYSSIVDVIQLA